jgi:alkyl hydroperoxide reductase subunit AhpC
VRRAVPLLLVCACAQVGPYRAKLGAQAPRFTANTLNQEWSRVAEVDLEKAVAAHPAILLSFGASYCGPCLLEWPLLRDVAVEYRERGLLVIFVVIDQDPQAIAQMRVMATENLGISSPVIADLDGELARRYGIDHLPQLYLIDDAGELVWHEIGYRGSTLEELTERLEGML